MTINPVTGLNIINNFLRLAKVKIPIDAKGIKYVTKMILTRELNLYFSKLRKEDEIMSFEMLNEFSEEELNLICIRRGIEIEDRSFE